MATTMTATEIAAAVRGGTLTARAATEAALQRIAERDPDVLAFRTVRAERSRAEADEIDGSPDRALLPLAGVPIAVKDNVPVAGEMLENGSAGSDRSIRAADHEVVARLRAAGAVIVGLSNVPELCVFGATDSARGITRNPWNLDRSPGGSSGGSAAAVAAGMVPVAHGNDGMGSIRIPAACTGLVGLKPGLGTVPADLGNGSWFDMAENGPLATTVADCALLLAVMAGWQEGPVLDTQGNRSLRIGVSIKAPLAGLPVDAALRESTRSTGNLLATLGHRVVARELTYPIRTGLAELSRWFAGTELDARLLADRSRLEPRIARHARLGAIVLAMGGPRDRGRERWIDTAQRYFEEVDVLVTPMLAQPPLRAVAWSERGWATNLVHSVRYAPFAAPWNLAGWPAMAVPAGVHPDGTPLSVQLVGRPGSERTLLDVAAQLEQIRPWRRTASRFSGPS